MTDVSNAGRSKQKYRTRKSLLQAGSRLVSAGRNPTLEEVAEAALVSRATAYRYFSNVEDLLTEAALDIETPDPDTLFTGMAETSPVARMLHADAALARMAEKNEASLRRLHIAAHQQRLNGATEPTRQNRRTALIEAALAPSLDRIDPESLKRLKNALALVLGTESMIVFKDVLQIGPEESRETREWAIRALIEAACKG